MKTNKTNSKKDYKGRMKFDGKYNSDKYSNLFLLEKMPRYKENLRVNGEHVYSYNTRVARIDHKTKQITCLGWWSVTTSKHINYVASEYGYEVIK